MGSSAGAVNNLTYKLNSIFDIDGASGTPQGSAELQTKFKKVHVLGSRVSFQLRQLAAGAAMGNIGGGAGVGVAATHSSLTACVLYPLPSDGIAATSALTAAVQKYATKRFDWPMIFQNGVAGAGENSFEYNPRMTYKGKSSMTVAKLDADPVPKQDSYVAGFGSDPTHLQYWIFAFQDLFADVTFKGVWQAEVEISYDCYCYERIVVGDALLRGAGLSVRAIVQMGSKPQDAYETKQASMQLRAVTPSTPVDARPPAGWTLVRKVASLK